MALTNSANALLGVSSDLWYMSELERASVEYNPDTGLLGPIPVSGFVVFPV
jgi:hypothetical protein